jgi:uncharacterized iron-regulated membrane protein
MNARLIILASAGIREAFGLTAIVATLLGVWLQWKRQAHLAEIEESVKNGRLASDEARQRSRFVDWRAQVLVIVGMALLMAVALGWIE